MIDPSKLGEVIAWQFPQSIAGVDWLVTARAGVDPALVAWDAVAMGQAQPSQATIDGWETTYNAAAATRTAYVHDAGVWAHVVQKLRVNGIPPEAALARLIFDIIGTIPVASRTARMTQFRTLLTQADGEVP